MPAIASITKVNEPSANSTKFGPPKIVPDSIAVSSKRKVCTAASSMLIHNVQDAKTTRTESLPSISTKVFVEFCAGSAKLSAAFRNVGFQVIAVDQKSNEHFQHVRCTELDLSKQESWELVCDMLSNDPIHHVHLGPPCGTASAARNRPVPQHLVQAGAPNPPPLRSRLHPLGLPGLHHSHLARVLTANRIYIFCSKVVRLCVARNILVSVENPENSLFWWVPCIADLFKLPELEWVVFDSCMFGGARAKATGLLCSKSVFSPLQVRCQNDHYHKPWSLNRVGGEWLFDTKEEAEYPLGLCQQIASLSLSAAIKQGYAAMPTDSSGVLSERQQRLWSRAVTGKLPRGRKLPQLVSEFASVEEVIDPDRSITKEFRLLRQFYKKGDTGGSKLVRIVGKFRDPESFIAESLECEHPIDSWCVIPDNIRKALFNILTLGPVALSKLRIQSLIEIKALAKELDGDEEILRQRIPCSNRRVLSQKRLALFDRLLKDTCFPDKNLVDDIITGFDVVGRANRSFALFPRLIPATITTDELRSNSVWSRRVTLAKCTSSGDVELDSTVYEETIKQCNDGWLRGPFTAKELDERHPKGWVPICRFGLKQGAKTRIIDECRGPSINFALTTTEKLALMDVDDLAALTKLISNTVGEDDGNICIGLQDGSELRGRAHDDWGKLSELSWLGRNLDLKDAYKNLANSDQTKWAAVLATFCPKDGSIMLHESDTLMFGSTSAVYAFNRCARALWHIAVSKLSLLVHQFYDDFPGVEPAPTANLARKAFEGLLKLLGWTWSTGDKCLPFDRTFTSLGVQFDLASLGQGVTIVSNKPSRVTAIVEQIDCILEDHELDYMQAAALHGKLQYCESQVFGRAAIPALQALKSRANCKSGLRSLDQKLCSALEFLKNHLLLAKPRIIRARTGIRPIVAFTDGSSEGDNHLWGIVLFVDGMKPQVAGGVVPEVLVDCWKSNQDQIICQVELFPLLLMRSHFSKLFLHEKVIYFIDNDPARDALISGVSGSVWSQRMVEQFYLLESSTPSHPWFARVPSFSNPADLPSRDGVQQAAINLGGDVFECELDRRIIEGLCISTEAK